MMMATIQNILLILKAPLWNTFYLHRVKRQHGFLSFHLNRKQKLCHSIYRDQQAEKKTFSL